ncbi:MAG: lipoprotein [Halioglobus sp.]|nr:lipoprotein [Halioglobus sp.]
MATPQALICATIIALALSGCGQMGPLYLPEVTPGQAEPERAPDSDGDDA